MARAARARSRAGTAGRKLRRLLAQRALGEPRVVIGIDADEAEYLAEFPDRDECTRCGQSPLQQASLQQVPYQPGPLQSGPLQQVSLTGPVPEVSGGRPTRNAAQHIHFDKPVHSCVLACLKDQAA